MGFVERLVNKQKELGLSNGAFAERLGVSRVHWIGIKTGRRVVGDSVRLGALVAFGLSDEDQAAGEQRPIVAAS